MHAAQTVRESGRDAVMVNCNPETVSTDYDTSDRLYFEPLTLEDVLAVCEVEQPEGVVVQFGGQTPLKLAAGLHAAGVNVLGTSIDAIDLAEDRSRFGSLLDELGYSAPPYATARSADEALAQAPNVGFPLLVRPSYVLGGRAMEIVYDLGGLEDYLRRVGLGSGPTRTSRRLRAADDLPRPLPGELDRGRRRRAVRRRRRLDRRDHAARRGGRHPFRGLGLRAAAAHARRTRCCNRIREQTVGIARALGVVGLLNVQFAIRGDDRLYVIEANPRASRTVPFVSKAIGLPLAKLACRIMLGERVADVVSDRDRERANGDGHVCVKEAVLPFSRFAGADSLLGPEMRSTGEVMGIASDFPTAFAKAQAAAGAELPESGTVFLTVSDGDKAAAVGIATMLHDLGFRIIATRGTAQALERMSISATRINKLQDGSPHVVDWIERGDVDLVINTPTGSGARADGYEIRAAAVARGIPCITTMSGAMAATRAIIAARRGAPDVVSLQELHRSAREHNAEPRPAATPAT